jgi:hypothetical protein
MKWTHGDKELDEFLEHANSIHPSIKLMLTLVLKNNNFTFDGNHYLQINGTAMGTKMAPSYANIFMGDLEERLLSLVT